MPDTQTIVIGVAALAFIVWIIKQNREIKAYIRDAAGVKDRSEVDIHPQPLRVTKEPEFLEAAAMGIIKDMIEGVRTGHVEGDSRLEKRIDELHRLMEEMRKDSATEASKRASSIHRRMDDFQKELGDMPARVVALLKETKGLIG